MTVYEFPFPLAKGLDLEPEFGHLLRNEPVARIRMPYGDEAWLVTRYDDVRLALSDRRFSRAMTLEKDPPRVSSEYFAGGIVAMDPPQHTVVKSTAGGAFGPRRLKRFWQRSREISDSLLAGLFDQSGQPDAIESYVLPFSLHVICELLGVPYEDHAQFGDWARAGIAATAVTEEERMSATINMWDYMSNLLTIKRSHPEEDMFSTMVQAADQLEEVGDEDLVMFAMAVLVAGYETTAAQLPNFLYLLLTQRHFWDSLRADSELIPSAVEELMRYVPLETVGTSPRYVIEDVELGEYRLRAGDAVVPTVAIANRDPAKFSDPEKIILDRNPNPHMGFGHGPHVCIGAPLARIELCTGLASLIANVPTLDLAPEDSIEWKSGMMVRGPAVLPVVRR
jgi:cytochrome P450